MKTEDDCTPLPDPFPLPKHFPHDVEVALKRRKLSSSEKRRFISEVASAMLKLRYPSREDYLCVARSIVATYPFQVILYVSNIKIVWVYSRLHLNVAVFCINYALLKCI